MLKEYSYVYIANCAEVMGVAYQPHMAALMPILLAKAAELETMIVVSTHV